MYTYHPKHLIASLTLLKHFEGIESLLIFIVLVANFQLCTILHPPKPKGNKHHIAIMLESSNNHV